MLQDPALGIGVEQVHRDPFSSAVVERPIGVAPDPGAIFKDALDLDLARGLAFDEGREDRANSLNSIADTGGTPGSRGRFMSSPPRACEGCAGRP